MQNNHVIVTGTGKELICATMPHEMTLHHSSAIAAYHYNGQAQILTVIYRAKNKRGENSVYQFFGVSRCLFDAIFAAQSLGRAMREYITHNVNKKFPYWKVAGYQMGDMHTA